MISAEVETSDILDIVLLICGNLFCSQNGVLRKFKVNIAVRDAFAILIQIWGSPKFRMVETLGAKMSLVLTYDNAKQKDVGYNVN